MITVFYIFFHECTFTYVTVLTNMVYYGECYTERYFETKTFWKMFHMKPIVKTHTELA